MIGKRINKIENYQTIHENTYYTDILKHYYTKNISCYKNHKEQTCFKL